MPRIPAYLLMSTLLSAGFALSAHAQASPPAPAAESPAATAPPASPPVAAASPAAPAAASDETKAEESRRLSRDADRKAMFDAHMAALHAGLALTPDQERLWPPVEQAIHGFASMRETMRAHRADRRQDRDAEDADQDPFAALQAESADMLERGQALKALADAAEPLYASLSEDQKHRLPLLLHDVTPPRGPLARVIGRLDRDERGSEEDNRGWMRHGWERGRFEEGGSRHQGWAEPQDGHPRWADPQDDQDRPPSREDRRAGMEDDGHDRGAWHHGWMRHGLQDEPGDESD